MKRKAVSPLIAVVLLVVFTIGIGIIVSSWLSGYTKSTTESAGSASSEVVECAKQIIDISDVASTADGGLKVRITNMGQVSTTIAKITAFDTNGNEWIITNTTLDTESTRTISKGDEKYFTNKTVKPSGFGATVYKVRATTLCSGVTDEWTNSTA